MQLSMPQNSCSRPRPVIFWWNSVAEDGMVRTLLVIEAGLGAHLHILDTQDQPSLLLSIITSTMSI